MRGWVAAVCLTYGFLAAPALAADSTVVEGIDPQPLMAQALRVNEALTYLGSALRGEDAKRLQELTDKARTADTSRTIQQVLDPYCLATVVISPESRVKVLRGAAKAELAQHGWKVFLLKVQNQAGTNPELQVESPNAAPALFGSSGAPEPQEKNAITPGQLADRFLELQIYRNAPMQRALSGLGVEYVVLQAYSKDAGKREVKLGFNVGQGSQDIGFRNALDILFTCKPSVKVVLHVKDDDGKPAMASFVITDRIERVTRDATGEADKSDYRLSKAESTPWSVKPLVGVYPLPSRRVASADEYPDFFFQPQVYRTDGEHVYLAPGEYTVTYTRGPEYVPQRRELTIREGVDVQDEEFKLKRWINAAKLGWYSADHHVHGGGCSHYESPEAGVRPEHMFRQALGEDLDVSCVLTWGPCWYHQKSYFEGKVNSLSTPQNLLRYDVEVSGFPSSHAGHVVLLRLKQDDYPGTTKIEEWPSWTLPVLQWAKGQGGVVGYAHSGWGLEPTQPTNDLPNFVMPKFDGIGANEYIVTATQGACDFISAGDTPAPWELNIWYHTLNCGLRTRISGETDFPCIFDERVGIARSYAKLDGKLDFDAYVDKIREGASYVSDGKSHLMDFTVNSVLIGTHESEVAMATPGMIHVSAKAAAYLPVEQDEVGAALASRSSDRSPYWDIERSRIGQTRKVPVELIVNGRPAARQEIAANGKLEKVHFDCPVERSSWVALRVLYSSHTNPVFVMVDGKPIRASKKSAEWCRASVSQCWEKKSPQIREQERAAAQTAYDSAQHFYDQIAQESVAE